MQYIVSIGYRKFKFDNAVTAISFAQEAKVHYLPDDNKDNLNVGVELINDEPLEEEVKED